MFQGFNGDLLSFCADIRFNNNKAFMDAHRKEYYQKVRDPYYAFIETLAPTMLQIDGDMEVRPHKCLSRINRDTRYSRDKSPYRDHHWVAFRLAAIPKDGMPMFWFEIRLESVSWGLGVWGENRNLMDALRRRMEADPGEMQRMLQLTNDAGFILDGDRWKKMKPPAGLPLSVASVYNLKTVYFEKQNIDPAWIFEPTIAQRVAKDFLALKPVWKLLRGLSDLGEETYD